MGKGKLLSLGPKLRYPIIVTKLLKKPGGAIQKQESLFQYTFKWMRTVGDALHDEEWEEEQTSFADWDSSTDGTIKSWKIHEGMTINSDMEFVEVEEDCPHSIQFAGLCGICGKDMTETSWASETKDTERAKINMIHDQNFLTVSEGVAEKAEETLQRRLLEKRKLSLVVDLDQTIIHACIDPTVGIWQKDPSSPNYEAVKDVKSFQLDDGPRGLASGCWYYIKMRPGLKEFLDKVSEMYELHVYTMGTRAYARNIAKIVDPDKKLFGDRIISRDENGNMLAKSLARLFPVDTKMVVIIDDRADVWPRNRPNLIKVHPYDFFLGIGDINSSFLPKREELGKQTASPKKVLSNTTEADKSDTPPTEEASVAEVQELDGATSPSRDANGATEVENGDARVNPLVELVKMSGGDDQALREQQTVEQEKYLEKQLAERPLLHMQEKLDEEDADEINDEKNGDATKEHQHHRHGLLKDDDAELLYLEKHLTQVHKAFYDRWDNALIKARGGRVAQLIRPGHNRKVQLNEEGVDLNIVPDIGLIMPPIKDKVLKGTRIVLSALVPLGQDLLRSEIGQQTRSFGAELHKTVSKRITHVVAPNSTTRTHKVREAARNPKIKVVTLQWLLDAFSKWQKPDETPYLIELHDQDRKLNEPTSGPPSEDESEEDENETASEDETESFPASQEEEFDSDGLMPDEHEGHSPIDDLKTFNWGEADEELADFLDDGESGDDSDASSVVSDSTRPGQENSRGIKRSYATDDGESDDGNATAKKLRISASRTTGLKTVKTPNTAESESTLNPVDENEEDEADSSEEEGADFDDDLEAEMMREFEREEQEAADGPG